MSISDNSILLLYSLLLFSCSSVENGERQVPVSGTEGSFYKVKDGTEIFIYDYKPEEDFGSTIYIMSGVTGINHNSEKDIIELISYNKNRVVVIHPRGTGYSEGKRGDIAKFDDFINDYKEIIENDPAYLSQKHKLILYGHSMSAAVALSVADKLKKTDGVILVNPPYLLKGAKGMSPGIRQYIKYAFYFIFAPHKPVVNMAGDPAKIENETDRKDAESRINDPLLVRYFSLYLMSGSRKMMDSMVLFAQKNDTPLLLIYGMKDNIVDKKGCDKIFEGWKGAKKQYVQIVDGPHGKETVIKAGNQIKDWMEGLN